MAAPRAALDVNDAADFLGVHRNTLYRMIRDAELPAEVMPRRIGGRWRFSRKRLEAWLNNEAA